jgi:quinol monooxygenase YgiN
VNQDEEEFKENPMIIVMARVKVLSDKLDEAPSLSKQHVDRSRKEPGCFAHAVYKDLDQDDHLVFIEEWESQDALTRHFAVPASIDFVNTLISMAVGRPRFRLYTATELPFPKSAA